MKRDLRNVRLQSTLRRIEDRLDEDDLIGARDELRRASDLFPDSLDLREHEAFLLVAEERLSEALEVLDEILARDPDRATARRERASVLVDLGRFPEALGLLRELLAGRVAVESDEDLAEIHHEIGLCLDREGHSDDADEAFHEAARTAPGVFLLPPRLPVGEFERVVADAVDSIPDRFHHYVRQVAISVEDYPPANVEDPFLLGLYVGVPRTERHPDAMDPPDNVFIYKRNHELLGLSPEDLREEVRRTVVHEIAHHFGLQEDSMGEYA